MRFMAVLLGAALAAGLAAPAAAQGTQPAAPAGSSVKADDRIVARLARSQDHRTLVAALKAAGLVELLNGAGPFTLFAPTDAAFQKLPAGTVEALLKPENREQLTAILTFHAVAGERLSAASLMDAAAKGGGAAQLRTVQGGAISGRVDASDMLVLVDGQGNRANVTGADIEGSNGVIHAVDRVLLPGTN